MSSPTGTRSTKSRAAAARRLAAEQRRAVAQQRRKRRIAAGAVAVTIALAAAVGIVIGNLQGSGGTTPTGTPPGVTEAGGVLVGSPTAPVQVVLYEDPQCPVCARFEASTGRVLAQAVAEGKVVVEYRMRLFLGPESARAVNALAAAQAEGKFDALRRIQYQEQPVEGSGGYPTDDLIRMGASAGLTSEDYIAAVRKMTYEAWARATDDRASLDGNVATPELRIDGKPVPAKVLFDAKALAKALGLS
ncbi:MAG: thioredoxin domain-containing protein [Frankiaceae bacterium]|nr:thioredoxin domain-containing protein [Frankiaceae bacterium]